MTESSCVGLATSFRALGGHSAAEVLGDDKGIDHVASLVHYLGGRGAEVRYRGNTLALLEPDGPGVVADFAAERGEGILGVSLEVGDLPTALSLINANTGLELQSFKYKGRERFLIPSSLTHGLLIEMAE